MKIIIYGSQYGTAKQYAEELSKKTNIKAESYENIKSVDEYETIIYIGALYAGGVLGLAKTLKKISNCESKRIIIATVGLADPMDIENKNNIKNGIKRQLTNEIYERAYIYHLRGGIDYSKLNFAHKTMMSLLYKKAKGLPEEKKTAEVKAMIDTYNQKVNFVDFSSLENIISEIQK
ncbi:MAG: flavodoxin domain-containing protein [Clostridia bacterium]